MINDVKVFKLITGEEVIARVEQKNTMFILDRPMLLSTILNQQGIANSSLAPWIMSGKNEKITISVDHVIAEDDPQAGIEKNYLAIVTGLSL